MEDLAQGAGTGAELRRASPSPAPERQAPVESRQGLSAFVHPSLHKEHTARGLLIHLILGHVRRRMQDCPRVLIYMPDQIEDASWIVFRIFSIKELNSRRQYTNQLRAPYFVLFIKGDQSLPQIELTDSNLENKRNSTQSDVTFPFLISSLLYPFSHFLSNFPYFLQKLMNNMGDADEDAQLQRLQFIDSTRVY